MKIITSTLLAFLLCFSFSEPNSALTALQTPLIPTFSINNIIPDVSITIRTYNFPIQDTFNVFMGSIETKGANGVKAAVISSESSSSFTATINIPPSLRGQYQIGVRFESITGSGYLAYNWFYNDISSGSLWPSTGPTNKPIPTFSIVSVVRDVSVTITTNNFPAHDRFDVFMGYMGTRGINGIRVATVSSSAGGALNFTFNIPPALFGQYQIAIRLKSNTSSGYYSYNWFYNDTAGYISFDPGSPPPYGYIGYPTFSIADVVHDTSVTIITNNLPPKDQFRVTMSPMGTRGIDGYFIATINSGDGGTQTFRFNIPPQLHGLNQLSIRLQSITGSRYFAYNWFFN